MTETVRQAQRAAREAAGISLASLARQATFSESHLRSIENGNRRVTGEVVDTYEKALATGGLLVDLFMADQSGDEMRRRAAPSLLGTITGLGVTAPRLIAGTLREACFLLLAEMIGKKLLRNMASVS